MSQSQQTDDEDRKRVVAASLSEGDRVFMGIHVHGMADDYTGVEYERDIHQAGVTGVVTEALSESEADLLEDGSRPMANMAVEDDDGNVFRWNVDNGYVIGYHDAIGRRTDIGKFGGFYEA